MARAIHREDRLSLGSLQPAAGINKTLRVDLEFLADAGGDAEGGDDGTSDVFADARLACADSVGERFLGHSLLLEVLFDEGPQTRYRFPILDRRLVQRLIVPRLPAFDGIGDTDEVVQTHPGMAAEP